MTIAQNHENKRVRGNGSTKVREHDSTITQINKCSSFPLKRNEVMYKESDGRRNRVVEYWRDVFLEV